MTKTEKENITSIAEVDSPLRENIFEELRASVSKGRDSWAFEMIAVHGAGVFAIPTIIAGTYSTDGGGWGRLPVELDFRLTLCSVAGYGAAGEALVCVYELQ